MAYFGRSLGSTTLILLMTGTCFALIGALNYFRKPVRTVAMASTYQHKNAAENMMPPPKKIIAMKNEVAVAEQ
jgi:hypothetical protein